MFTTKADITRLALNVPAYKEKDGYRHTALGEYLQKNSGKTCHIVVMDPDEYQSMLTMEKEVAKLTEEVRTLKAARITEKPSSWQETLLLEEWKP